MSGAGLKGSALLPSPWSQDTVFCMAGATLLPGFRAHVADICGVRTLYYVGGAGEPLILVHGLGGAAVNFTELAPLLARRRRVLVPNLPGHGGSAPLPEVRDLGSYADHVAAVAEREEMLPAAVLGYSMGGVVALRLAVARPDATRALVLVAAAGIVSVTRRADVWLRAMGLLRPTRFVAPFRHVFARRPRLRHVPFAVWGANDPPTLSPQAVLGFLEGTVAHTDTASAAKALLTDDPRPDLDRVGCPTLLLWGARDRLVPLADGFEYARRLRASIRTLPATGHLLVGERPADCAAVIDDFLDGIGEVDELPLEAELLGELRRQRADA
jgi:pimeloyl-ACP methyl ester carboxylesterase